jgi:hypothetical protein
VHSSSGVEARTEGAQGIVMQIGLTKEHAKMHVCASGLILDGFTVAEDHSIVLCEQGKEWFHSKKRPEARLATDNGIREREHRG